MNTDLMFSSKTDNKNYTVYKHISPSGKIYIGITSQTVNHRWRNGKGYKIGYFSRAIKKYGWDNFIHEVMFENLTKTESEQKESELINYYSSATRDKGYNIESGNGCICYETKEKISKTLKEKYLNGEIVKIINNGESHTGWHHTKEAKEKIRVSSIGRLHTLETKEKISKCKKGKKLSEERINQLSEVSKAKKKVVCITTGEIFNSLTEASKKYNIHMESISRCCRGGTKMAGKKIWKYYVEGVK